jgi:hypothetical protein
MPGPCSCHIYRIGSDTPGHEQEYAMTTPTPRDQDEYTALRATIRERGTARVWIVVAGVVAWAGLTIGTAAAGVTPLSTLVPLLVLAAVFEAVYALHIGVERVGRYIQVFHESDAPGVSGWEHAALAFGRPAGAAALDALFTIPLVLAATINLMFAFIVVPPPTTQEIVFVGGAHALFLLRLLAARHTSSKQRAIDLARFRTLRQEGHRARGDEK